MSPAAPWVERILLVADHIQAHLDEPLEPETLADIAGFSLHHFHRVFRGMTGESVMGFIRRLRLERAASRLKFGDEPVTSVAFDAGYGSHEAFTRAFRARFGMPPREYRDRERSATAAAELGFEMRDEAERACLALRHTGPYAECSQAWTRLYAAAGPTGVLAAMTGSLGLVYDDPEVTDADHLRYDACLVVPADVARRHAGGDLVARVVPAGRYAVARYRGPYDDIDDTYLALLGRWMPLRGLELARDPVVEVYVNSPIDTAPADLLTDVCVRIA